MDPTAAKVRVRDGVRFQVESTIQSSSGLGLDVGSGPEAIHELGPRHAGAISALRYRSWRQR